MQRSTTPSHPGYRARRTVASVLAFAAATLAAGSVQAQVLVTDVTSNAQTAAISTFQQGAEYAKSVEQAVTLASQLQQMISSINNVISNPIASLIPQTSTMTAIDDATTQSLIQAKCNPGGGPSNIVASALGAAVQAMNLNSSFAQQQQINCANIVIAEVDQYNATVKLYLAMPSLHNSMSNVTNLMGQISNFGDSSKASSQASTLNTQQNAIMDEWNTKVNADQRQIDTLNANQSILAAALLNSRPSLVGDIVQATALTAAFSIDQ